MRGGNRPARPYFVSSGLPQRERRLESPKCAHSPRTGRRAYTALVSAVDVAAVRKLYDEVTESALDGERGRVAETHRADPGLLDALRRYVALADSPSEAKVLGRLRRRVRKPEPVQPRVRA